MAAVVGSAFKHKPGEARQSGTTLTGGKKRKGANGGNAPAWGQLEVGKKQKLKDFSYKPSNRFRDIIAC